VRSRGRLRRCALGLGHALIAAAALAASPALALWEDKLTPFVEQKVTRDDNVFRAPSPTADTYSTTSLGFTLDALVSRQRFQAGYTWSATRYSQLSALDFNGHDARAIWLWQVGNDLSGQLGYTDNLVLAPFQYTQSTTPDPLRTRTAFLNATQLLTPRWRIQSGAGVFDQKNGPALQLSDINIASADASLSYVTPGNNSIGLSGRIEGAHFPNRNFAAGIGLPFDDSYRQTSVGLIGDWTVTGVSRVAARASYVSRRYPNTPQSNLDGYTAVAEYDWKVTGKLTIAGVVRRDISPFQDIQSTFVLVRGVTVRPTLAVTEKIDLSAVLDYSTWHFLGDPGLFAGGNQPVGNAGRVDRVSSGTASLSYKPLRSVTLQASVLREVRTSNAAGADYTVTAATVTARLSF